MFDWKRTLSAFPSGMTATELSKRLGADYQSTRAAIKKHGYKASDGRKFSQQKTRKLVPELVDWTEPPVAIARRWKVSKQRVCFIAKQLGIKTVDSRGRKASVKVR